MRLAPRVSLYINRKTRVRHADRSCPAIDLSDRYLDDVWDRDPKRRPTARIVEVPDSTDPAEVDAILEFTTPCVRCVPGARASWASLPFEFEAPDEYEPEFEPPDD